MIVFDSSAVLALVNIRDERHLHASAVARREAISVLPAAALGEIAYFIEDRHGQRHLARFVRGLIAGAFEVDPGIQDYPRVLELVERYADLSLGLVDAAVIACAERNGGRVLTYDYRHFGTVAAEGTITLVQ